MISTCRSQNEQLPNPWPKESIVPNHHPHRRRVHFRDREDNDWEFVEYNTEELTPRNDYDLPD